MSIRHSIYAKVEQVDTLALTRTFVAVIESGSFSAAARRLSVTPSAVSKQVAALESGLRARLLKRTTRSVAPTEAGEIYFARGRRLVEDADAAQAAVQALRDSPSGVLRLSTTVDLAIALLEPLAPEFADRFPGIELRISVSTDYVDLAAGAFDLALRMGHLEDSSMVARVLGKSRSRLYASPDYVRRRGAPQAPADLQDHACLSFQSRAGGVHWSFRVGEERLGVPIRGPLRADSLLLLREAAARGQGIAMLPRWIAREFVEDGRLVEVLGDATLDPPSTPIQALFADRRYLAAKISSFLDFLGARVDLEASPVGGARTSSGVG